MDKFVTTKKHGEPEKNITEEPLKNKSKGDSGGNVADNIEAPEYRQQMKTVKETLRLHLVISLNLLITIQPNHVYGSTASIQKESPTRGHLFLLGLTNTNGLNILKNEMQCSVLRAGTLHLQVMKC